MENLYYLAIPIICIGAYYIIQLLKKKKLLKKLNKEDLTYISLILGLSTDILAQANLVDKNYIKISQIISGCMQNGYTTKTQVENAAIELLKIEIPDYTVEQLDMTKQLVALAMPK